MRFEDYGGRAAHQVLLFRGLLTSKVRYFSDERHHVQESRAETHMFQSSLGAIETERESRVLIELREAK